MTRVVPDATAVELKCRWCRQIWYRGPEAPLLPVGAIVRCSNRRCDSWFTPKV
jgi:hypothetical protein